MYAIRSYYVQELYIKKSRDKHSHHAIDATVLTMIPTAAKRDEILHIFYEYLDRITSYNVCYTKLLRFDIKQSAVALRPQVLKMSKKIRHRGPDWSGIFSNDKAILAHERLSIVDPESGKQPLFSKDGKLVLAVNGEIYNHQEIRDRFEGKYEFLTKSDCEVILALYREKGTDRNNFV